MVFGAIWVTSLMIGAAPAEPPVVAVFELRDERPSTERIGQVTLASLTTYLGTLLTKTGRFRVVPTADIQSALRDAKRTSFEACYDESCQIEIGKAVAAQLSLDTRIGRIGSSCVLTSSLFGLREEATFRAASMRGGCSEDALTNAVEGVASQLADPKAVATAPPPPLPMLDAAIVLDTPRVTSPMAATRAAFGGSDAEWSARLLVLRSDLTADQFTSYHRSGVEFPVWADRYNSESESMILEVSRWLFTALSVVALSVAVVDKDARSASGFWISSTLIAHVPTVFTWGLDLANFGNVDRNL